MKPLTEQTSIATDSQTHIGPAKVRRCLTLLVPGTEWRRFGGWGEDNALFRFATDVLGADAGGTRTELFEWPGGNSDASRLEAADALRGVIAAAELLPDDVLNVVGHSHGGNVALLAANLELPRAIDNLITLNKPTLKGSAYQAGAVVRSFFNVSARRDWLQWAGSNAKFSFREWAFDARAENFVVDTSASALHPHAALIWDDGMRGEWYGWLRKQIAQGATRYQIR